MEFGIFSRGTPNILEMINAILLENALETRLDAAKRVEMLRELKQVIRRLDVGTMRHTDSPNIQGYIEACRKSDKGYLHEGAKGVE